MKKYKLNWYWMKYSKIKKRRDQLNCVCMYICIYIYNYMYACIYMNTIMYVCMYTMYVCMPCKCTSMYVQGEPCWDWHQCAPGNAHGNNRQCAHVIHTCTTLWKTIILKLSFVLALVGAILASGRRSRCGLVLWLLGDGSSSGSVLPRTWRAL